jgi:hypothetical protein
MRHASLEAARRVFDAYARLEPELTPLWTQCRHASPPASEEPDDVYDVDSFIDDQPADDWCAEDFFQRDVKWKLFGLVGVDRALGPEELQTSKAYETVYDVLLNWALNRTCRCCTAVDASSQNHGTAAYC